MYGDCKLCFGIALESPNDELSLGHIDGSSWLYIFEAFLTIFKNIATEINNISSEKVLISKLSS